jgi:hypothetical protein
MQNPRTGLPRTNHDPDPRGRLDVCDRGKGARQSRLSPDQPDQGRKDLTLSGHDLSIDEVIEVARGVSGNR